MKPHGLASIYTAGQEETLESELQTYLERQVFTRDLTFVIAV
jgi:hypothetical protein